MTVNLVPNKAMQDCLAELVQGRKILHVVCEPTPNDIYNYNIKKAKNLGDNKISIICVNNNKAYESISKAARALGLDPGAISKCISNKQESTNGFRFIKTTKATK